MIGRVVSACRRGVTSTCVCNPINTFLTTGSLFYFVPVLFAGTPSQRYLDDWTVITGKELNHNSTLILEVKACAIKKGKKKGDPETLNLTDVGWTCVPLFDAGTILSGYYQLPL